MARRLGIISISVMMIIIIGVIIYFFVIPNIAPGEDWTWQLTEDENVVISFTTEQLLCSGPDPDDVFESINTPEINPVVFYYDAETNEWYSWWGGEPHNSLTTIEANELYVVSVDIDCTLVIERC